MLRQVIVINGGSTYRSYEDYLANLKSVKLDFKRLMQKGWKESFAQKLGPRFQVVQPKMPNPNYARYTEWVIWFEKLIPFIRSGAVLVGHSLGGLFLVRYLSLNTLPKRVQATILIATPYDEIGLHESLGDFNLPDCIDGFKERAGRIILYHSKEDPVVPYAHALNYKRMCRNAELRTFTNRGHFNQPTFPELVRGIRGL